MSKWLACLSFLLAPAFLSAQKYSISGYIKDADTGESLIGATVIQVGTSSGTTANAHGFYSLTLPRDSVTLLYSYVGYTHQVAKFLLRKDTTLQVMLKGSTLLNEVVVEGAKADAIHEVTRMSTVSVPIEQIKSLPAFLGETDVLKVLQLTM